MKLIKTFIAALLLAFGLNASAQEWPLYDDFMNLHYKDGRIYDYDNSNQGFTTSEGQSYGMFFALIQKDKERFDRMLEFIEKELCEGSFDNKLPSWKFTDKTFDKNNATDSDLFIAYDLICASELFTDESYLTKAKIILKKVKKHCVVNSKMLGSLLLPGTYGFKNDEEFVINPSYYPPFVMQKIASIDRDYLVYYENALQAITKGSEFGFVADWLTFNSDGLFVIKPETQGSYDAIRYYLWLGISSNTDPNTRIMLSLYKNMINKVSDEYKVPEKVNLYKKEFSGQGNIGFEASLMVVTDYKVRDFFRTRVKNYVFSKKDYYSHCLTLFATGFDEHRYKLTQDGSIKVGE